MLLLALGFSAASAQLEEPDAGEVPEPTMSKYLAMDSSLWDLNQALNALPQESLQAEAGRTIARSGLLASDDAWVKVEIVNQRGDQPLDEQILTGLNIQVTAVFQGRISAWVPALRLIELESLLPEGYYLEAVFPQPEDDEGPGVIGSDDYRDNNADGVGIHVAVIDGGFDRMGAAQTGNAAPDSFDDVWDFVGGDSDPFHGSEHGTACVETVFDHAPDATYSVYRVSNPTELGSAVQRAIDNNVDIISHSRSEYNTGWVDDSGAACDAVELADGENMLFFTSSGNRAESHWQGDLEDDDDDDWHEWSGTDELLRVSMPNDSTAWFYLSWDTAGGTFDYDLYLVDGSNNTLDSSIASGNNYEQISYTNDTGSTQLVYVKVSQFSGGITEMELFMTRSGLVTWQEHADPVGSNTSPSNCTGSWHLISVGAVNHWEYGDLPGSNNITSYSSQGPTNSNQQAPRLVGPTGVTTIAYGGAFHGTSASTPNAAGAAAAFWSSVSYMRAAGVKDLLHGHAKIFKDWGTAGVDPVYGSGGIALHTYHLNTRWVNRDSGNTFGFQEYPYYNVSHAQTHATAGGRIVILGDSYPEPVLLDKQLLYESIGEDAVLGGP
jgi:hypothetical protein